METLNIIDARARDNILTTLLNKHGPLIHQRFMSFDQVFYPSSNKIERIQQATQIIHQHKDEFSLLKNALDFEEIIIQAIDFLDLLDRYSIDIDDCPQNNELDQEKTHLIKTIANQIERPYLSIKSIDVNSVVVHPFYYQPYHLLRFQKCGIHVPENIVLNNQEIKYKKALNPRQEVSGLLEIINNYNHVLIQVGDPSYIQELKRQMTHLNVSYLDETQINPINLAAYYFIKALHTQDKEPLIHFFTLNVFDDQYMDSFLTIIKRHDVNFNQLINGLPEINYNFESELNYQLNHQHKQYQQAVQLSKSYVQRFKAAQNENPIIHAFNLLTKTNQTQNLYNLKQLLEENYHLITDHNLLSVLESTLLKPIKQLSKLESIVVSDCTYIPNKDYDLTVFLGMTQQNFPGFKSLGGLYNEEYVKDIRGFPSLESRIQLHHQQMMNRLQSAQNIIISYPLMDYQGKPYQTSFEIEEFLNNLPATPWKFEQGSGQNSLISNIDPNTAQQLFMAKGVIKGSVSSLETFTTNSFQYFLERGLNLKSIAPFELDVASIGTLSHKVLEVLIKQQGKNYVHSSLEEIRSILKPTFDQMIYFYPHKENHYQLSLERLAHLLAQKLNHLEDYETQAGYYPDPQLLEYKFNQFKLFDELPLAFTGIIDRIDLSNDGFIILDYKSSKKVLDKNKIRNGQQLQLITYALVAQRILKQVCLGAYYIPLTVSLDKPIKFKLNTTSFELNPPQTKTKLVSGKGFDPLVKEYLNPKRTQLYSKEVLEPYFNKLYAFIANSITQGILTNFIQENEYFYFNDLQRNKESYSQIDELYLEIDPDIDFVLKKEADQ